MNDIARRWPETAGAAANRMEGGRVTDEEASARFREVVMPHLADALALARWLTGNRHDAEDVVQEACIRAFSGIGGYSGGSPRGWLLSIVRNCAFTWLARNRPQGLVLTGDPDAMDAAVESFGSAAPQTPEAALIAKAETARVEAAIEALPHPFREVLALRDINGLSYREIAAMLAIPIGTVMSRLARARSLLLSEIGRPA